MLEGGGKDDFLGFKCKPIIQQVIKRLSAPYGECENNDELSSTKYIYGGYDYDPEVFFFFNIAFKSRSSFDLPYRD